MVSSRSLRYCWRRPGDCFYRYFIMAGCHSEARGLTSTQNHHIISSPRSEHYGSSDLSGTLWAWQCVKEESFAFYHPVFSDETSNQRHTGCSYGGHSCQYGQTIVKLYRYIYCGLLLQDLISRTVLNVSSSRRGGDGVMTVTLTFSPLRAIDNLYLISFLWSMLTIESVDV